MADVKISNLANLAAAADDDELVIVEVSAGITKKIEALDLVNTAHTHDGQTLQFDGVNSNGGAFTFTTSGKVTFSQGVGTNDDFYLLDTKSIGIGPALERLEFYTAGYAAFMGCNVGIGTTTIPHGAVGYAKFAIEGADTSSAGPHVQFTTDADDYPLIQIVPYLHDNIMINFDSYFDGAFKSSDAGSNFQIHKASDFLKFRYDSGIAAGNVITWNDGIVLDTAGNVKIASLAGIGARAVVAAADGALSAP